MEHNRRVRELQSAAESLSETRRSKNRPERSMNDSASQNEPVRVEQVGNSFVLVVSGARLFLSLQELKSLVKIAQSAAQSASAASRLYHWMATERQDMIQEAHFADRHDARLVDICHVLKDQFTTG